MQNNIVIVDYGMGNLRSVQKKFSKNGIPAIVSSDVEKISNASKLVLPGVGHFAKGVKTLKELGGWDVLREIVLIKKTPILGICLGMQLMTNYSEEGNVDGFGWVDADVVKFKISDKIKLKVPHMGWNNIAPAKKHHILKGIEPESQFYFVHSYHVICNDQADILTTTKYDYEFVSSFKKDNIYGFQFHPEKSHDQGEQIIKNFIQL